MFGGLLVFGYWCLEFVVLRLVLVFRFVLMVRFCFWCLAGNLWWWVWRLFGVVCLFCKDWCVLVLGLGVWLIRGCFKLCLVICCLC